VSRRRPVRPFAVIDITCKACGEPLGRWGREADQPDRPWLHKAPRSTIDTEGPDGHRIIWACECGAKPIVRMDRLAAALEELVRLGGERARATLPL
jgi:hypothetical protein